MISNPRPVAQGAPAGVGLVHGTAASAPARRSSTVLQHTYRAFQLLDPQGLIGVMDKADVFRRPLLALDSKSDCANPDYVDIPIQRRGDRFFVESSSPKSTHRRNRGCPGLHSLRQRWRGRGRPQAPVGQARGLHAPRCRLQRHPVPSDQAQHGTLIDPRQHRQLVGSQQVRQDCHQPDVPQQDVDAIPVHFDDKSVQPYSRCRRTFRSANTGSACRLTTAPTPGRSRSRSSPKPPRSLTAINSSTLTTRRA